MDRHNYPRQQEILRIINTNQKILASDYAISGRDLPPSMQWVIEHPCDPNKLIAKQSVVWGNDFEIGPARKSVTRVRYFTAQDLKR